ncbi:P-loop containing nucleoside triphosphate hydrolase protein [Exidia glandulosa HHB12029]|uniref:Structural maintenance of chromosomes protein 5 n=1 Tax=Exidia glandulosa HHB12029 TaxID=1314781 RepID=A0A165F8K9_EXIGL|nr:P-loop containing nucleoside triphosphate hydrolase protein [Exidia glandulosa HHB12029]
MSTNGVTRVKREKVAAAQSQRRATPSEPPPSKRIRISDAGDAAATQNDEEDEDGDGEVNGRHDGDEDDDAPALPRPVTLPRAEDGYVPGSIVRVMLKNFVTYDHVEFSPGPYLNMIIGPNGTGKSSIACALCIGLGWPPSILGRASELKAFVKNGCEEGFIEIELKGALGKGNLVIRRSINATDNKSIWRLNGQEVTGNEVKSRVQGLNVQVDNLCTFLPQDKVSSFAHMTPQQLLKETQKAAGHADLTKWHTRLIEGGKELKELEETLKADRANVEDKEARNARLEREVAKYKERREIEEKIAVYEILLPFVVFWHLSQETAAAETDLLKKRRVMEKMQAKNQPLQDLKATLERIVNDQKNARQKTQAAMQAKNKEMSKKWSEADNLERDAEQTQNQLNNIKVEERRRKAKMEGYRKEIERLQEKIANPPEVEDEEVLREDARKASDAISRQREAVENVRDDLRRFLEEQSRAKMQAEARREQLRRLQDVEHQRLESLRKWDQDTAIAVDWLRKNKDKFQMEVFEPAILSARVRPGANVDQVEACMGSSQFKTFVAQCKEDYDAFNHYVNDATDLAAGGRKLRVNVWFRPQGDLPPPPMSAAELKELKFEGYALDFLDCPEGMKWYFMRDVNMHRTALGSDAVDIGRAMELVVRGGGSGSCSFISGRTMSTVARSQYGQRKVQNQTRDIRPARNWANNRGAVDEQKKQELLHEIAEFEEQVKKLEVTIEEHNKREQKYKKEAKALQDDKAKVSARAEKRVKLLKEYGLAKESLRATESRLQTEEAQKPPEALRQQLKNDLLKIAKKRVRIAKDYTSLVRGFITEQENATRAILEVCQAEANLAALERLVTQTSDKFQRVLREVKEANETYKTLKAKRDHADDHANRILRDAPESVADKYREKEAEGLTQTSSVDEVQAKIETEKAKLELNIATNPAVVRQYEEREREILALQATVAEKEAKKKRLEKGIAKVKDQWLPALKQLVASINEKFSAAFERVHCAGEVHISEDEDYDKWAIDIMVKFRDSERLQLLTGHRQSGGERSLTTILYLMSLTELARAPFSLVDEINQGMDQRAERLVHNQLVDVTCREESGQYFLITPKLLPDLKYHERMKVLCINNGEWLPEQKGLGSLQKMLDNYIDRNGGRARFGAN